MLIAKGLVCSRGECFLSIAPYYATLDIYLVSSTPYKQWMEKEGKVYNNATIGIIDICKILSHPNYEHISPGLSIKFYTFLHKMLDHLF